MEDIKKLYQEAKACGPIHNKTNRSLRAYIEAVDSVCKNSPAEYVSNLEYIISSSYGANTFSTFLEHHKIPLTHIHKIKKLINHLRNKNEDSSLTDTYSDMIQVLESYESKYPNCMDMAIYFEDCLDDSYLEAYYANFPKLLNKNVNISKFFERYGNGCIPDMIVYTEASKPLLETVYDQMEDKKKKLSNNQWVKDSLKDFSYVDNEILDVFTKESLEYEVNQALTKNEQLFRESALLKEQFISPFTPSDIHHIEDFISYQEYKLCGAKNETERNVIMESVKRMKKALEPLMVEEDVADSVIPMLPGARVSKPILSKQFTEVLSMEKPEICYNQNNLPKPLDSVVNNIIKDLATMMKDLILTDSRFAPIKESYSFKNIEWEFDQVIEHCNEITYDVLCKNQSAPGIDIFNILDLYEYTDGPMEFYNPRDQLYDERAYYLGIYGFKNEAVSMLLAKTIFELLSEKYNKLLQNYGMILMNQEMIDNSNYIDTKCFVSGEYNLEIFIAICPSSENFARKLYNDILSNIITLPSSNNSFTEALSSNTRNKKTGKAPGYLKNNHDLSYGEDDDTDDSNDVGDDIFGDHIDDTSKEKKTSKTEPEPYQYDDDIDDESPDNAEKDKPASGANYYYYNYNYTNSNNTSNKSHNDYSTHTSHDSHDKKYHTINNTNSNNVTKTVDSHNQKNDNSTNKRVNSHDYGDHHEESISMGNGRHYIRDFTMNDIPQEYISHIYEIHSEFFKTLKSVMMEEYPKAYQHCSSYIDNRIDMELGLADFQTELYIDISTDENGNVLKKDPKLNIFGEFIEDFPNYHVDYDDLCHAINHSASQLNDIMFSYMDDLGLYLVDWDEEIAFYLQCQRLPYIDNITNHRISKILDNIASVYQEEVGDADDDKPESDNPIRDTMMDIDRKVGEGLGKIKRGAGKVHQTARAISKPFKKVIGFIDDQIEKWRDSNENDIKEQLADPHQSNSLIKAFKSAVKYGAIYKAGLLLNPIFIFLAAAKHLDSRNNKFRIRNEMIGELKTELQVLEEKIKDADAAGDKKAKYQMMRLKNELTKKLIRVGGTSDMKNMI